MLSGGYRDTKRRWPEGQETLNGIKEFGQGLGLEVSLKQSENVNGEVLTEQTTETKTTPVFLNRNPVIYPIDQLEENL